MCCNVLSLTLENGLLIPQYTRFYIHHPSRGDSALRSPSSPPESLGQGLAYCCVSGAAGHLGHQAVSELDSRVFGGDGQTFLQNCHQADPELKHSLRVFFVEPHVVDLLSHCPNPQDALEPVADL